MMTMMMCDVKSEELERENVKVCLNCEKFLKCESIGKFVECEDFVEVEGEARVIRKI